MQHQKLAPKPRVYGEQSVSLHTYNYLLTRTEQGATALAVQQGLRALGFKFNSKQVNAALSKGTVRGYFTVAATKQINGSNRRFYRIATLQEYQAALGSPKSAAPKRVVTPEPAPAPATTPNKPELAPPPIQKTSYTYAIYETLRALGKPSSAEEIRKLLPAAMPPHKPKAVTRKQLRKLLYQARHNGYVDHDDSMKYFIAPRDFFDEKHTHRQELNKKSRELREQQQDTIIKPSAANKAAGPVATPAPEVNGGRAIIVPEATVQGMPIWKLSVLAGVCGAVGALAVIGASTLFVG